MKYLDTDADTGSTVIREHSLPIPYYDIGDVVSFQSPNGTVTEGHITGYAISVLDVPSQPHLVTQTMYTINDGADEIMEDDVIELLS